MRIQHNIPALNAHRNLTNNNSSVSKNLEKLSSGYRINRAGDDAAGLAISEKMRSQITGLQTAQKNAEDGVSLVQTAEGALTEVHSMLNRMVELATQSANGTYSENNRQEMQKEIDALTKEIDRISETANFNGTKLFQGGETSGAVKATAVVAGAIATETVNAAVASVYTSGGITGGTDGDEQTFEIAYTDEAGKVQSATIKFEAGADDDATFANLKAAIEADSTLNELFTVGGDKDGMTLTSNVAGSKVQVMGIVASAGTDTTIDGGSITTKGTDETITYDMSGTFADGDTVTIGNETYTYAANADGSDGKTFKDLAALSVALNVNGNYAVDTTTNTAVAFTAKTGGATQVALHVGESSDDANTIDVKIKAMSSLSLGVAGVDITTVAGAKAAIDTVNAAIDDVSSIRSDLGALQNRLEHTINNLGVQTENITAAESRIRDVDMAKEMMAYTKNNILVQASQAMLAQANQVPQGVLQLLQ